MKTEWEAIAQMPNGYSIEDNKGRVIAMTQCDEDENDDNPITWQEEVENANLIASAPNLLNALQLCRTWFDEHGKDYEIGLPNCFIQAKAAINKAKGK
jgi:hypothetical protein